MLKRVLIGAATLAMAALVTVPTIALTLGDDNANIGLLFWPIGADAQARKAAELIAADPKGPTLEQADTLSRAALRREPINVTAARVQGVVAAVRGQESAALAWLRYAEQLSRRDFAVQTMLIELAVQRGDIPGALVHYDRALRTKKGAGDILFPVLFSAAADPAILPALTRLLRQRPEWWYDFIVRWQSQQPPAPPGPLFATLMAARPDISVPRERMMVINAMRQMVAAERVDLAARLHDKVAPGLPPAGTFVDGDFAMKSDLLPFAWDLVSETGLAGVAERRGEPARSVLTLDVGGDQGGTIAQQLVRLAPGRYRLAFRVGDVMLDGVVPSVSILCAGTNTAIAEQSVSPAETSQRSLSFQIDRGCAAQIIRIQGTAGSNDSLPRPWISDMVLQRLG